jgi:predicted nucleic acid-binding protein
LVEARRRELIPALRPLIDQMVENGCWLGEDLIRAVLHDVGEE